LVTAVSSGLRLDLEDEARRIAVGFEKSSQFSRTGNRYSGSL
jgi:hypothetical protein